MLGLWWDLEESMKDPSLDKLFTQLHLNVVQGWEI